MLFNVRLEFAIYPTPSEMQLDWETRVWHPILGGFALPNPYRAFGFPWGKLAAAV